METKNIKRIVGLCVLLLCFQQVTFAQGLIWKSQVIKRPDDAIIYKTKLMVLMSCQHGQQQRKKFYLPYQRVGIEVSIQTYIS